MKLGEKLNQTKYTSRNSRYWQLVLGLGIASFYVFATMYFFQPILPVLVEEYNINISYASLTMSLHTVGLIVGLIVVGFISDRKGRRSFIFLSILLSTIILFLLPYIPYFSFIVVLRFIQGFTLAGVLAVALAYMAEEIEPKYFSFAATLYISFNGFGGMMGRFVSSYLVEQYSYVVTLYVLGTWGFITFVITLLLLPKSNHFTQSNRRFSEDFKGFTYHLKDRHMLLMFGLGMVLQISFAGMWTFLPFHLIKEPFNLSLQYIAYFYLAYSFGMIIAPIAGWLAKKYPIRTLRVIGVMILTTGMFITLGKTLAFIIIGLAVICIGFFTSHSLASATVSKEAKQFKGSASSLYLVSYYLGVAIGTSGLTPIWDLFQWKGIIAITAMLPFIYVMIVRFVRRMNGVNTKSTG